MKDKRELFKALSLISQLGISMMVPIFLCVLLGRFIDSKFSTAFVVPLLFLGILAGFRNCYIIIKPFLESDDDKEK